MHKIVVDIFNIVAKFSLLLTSSPWNTCGGYEAIHPAFSQLQDTYKLFREYSTFLYIGETLRSCDCSNCSV